MKELIIKEHAEFKRLLDTVEATDAQGRKTDFTMAVEAACKLIGGSCDRGGQLVAVGNGGSAAIASHMVLDAWKNGGMKAISFSDPSLLTCIANDYGYDQVFAKPTEFFSSEGDTLVAISSSGKSASILNAVKAMRSRKGPVITLSGFKPDNPLRSQGDINFHVASNDYGMVEVIHQYICHLITDVLIQSRK